MSDNISYADIEAEVDPDAVEPGPLAGPTCGVPWVPIGKAYIFVFVFFMMNCKLLFLKVSWILEKLSKTAIFGKKKVFKKVYYS